MTEYEKTHTLNPFYFIVVVWGKQFCDYFTQFCLPSLLSPGNIPSLINKEKNKFLICTLPEDWISLQKSVAFQHLKQYIEPIFIEIPPPKPGVSGCQHMGIGHKLATNICYQDKAYGIALTPDLLLSDGTIAEVQKKALEGKHIVYCAALRFAEEPLFEGFHREGFHFQHNKYNSSQPFAPLTITGRQLVKVGIQAFHSQVKTYHFETAYFAPNSPAAYWYVPEEEGILLHSLTWCPLLLDYSVVKEHHTKAFDEWTMDGDYVYKNFFHTDQIYVSTDSDEMMLVSWSPSAYNPVPLKPDFFRKYFKSFRDQINGILLRLTLLNPLYDPMKVALFPIPVKWHSKDLNKRWDILEKRVQKIIHKEPGLFDSIFIFMYQWSPLRIFYKLLIYSFEYLRVIFFAICFDKKALNQIFRRIKIIYNYFTKGKTQCT